jgi:hypothetical protein
MLTRRSFLTTVLAAVGLRRLPKHDPLDWHLDPNVLTETYAIDATTGLAIRVIDTWSGWVTYGDPDGRLLKAWGPITIEGRRWVL